MFKYDLKLKDTTNTMFSNLHLKRVANHNIEMLETLIIVSNSTRIVSNRQDHGEH